jgi:hypothetical protein
MHTTLRMLPVLLSLALCSCQTKTSSPPRARAGVKRLVMKYSNPPTSRQWNLVTDSVQFFSEMKTLEQAAYGGDAEALRVLFVIRTYTDGAASEGFPDMYSLFERHRGAASTIIRNDPRLRKQFGHWLSEPPQ